MADGTEAKFTVRLDDGVSGTAEQAAKSLDRLRDSIDKDKAALANMQGAMRNLQGASVVNIQAFKDLQGRIEAQKQKIADTQQAYVNLGGTFEKTSKKKTGIKALIDEAKDAPGPIGQVASGLAKLTKSAPTVLVAAGAIALTAALAGLVAITLSAAASMLKYGLSQSNARRDELGRLEGLTLMRSRYRAAAGSAAELQTAIDNVSGSSSQGRGELEGMTERLYRMGFRGADLQRALEGAAMSTDVLGERGQSRFLMMAASARRTGGSIDALADRIESRLGPAAARRALSWDSQTARLQRNVGQIFSGLKIDALLQSVKPIFDIFSQSQASGRALKLVFETIFQPFVNQAAQGGPVIENVLLSLIIGVQNLTIFVNDIKLAWLRAFGTEVTESVDHVNDRLLALRAVLAPVTGDVGALALAWQRMRGVRAQGPTVDGNAAAQQGRSAGSAVTAGMAEGIRGGGGPVQEAMRELARESIETLRGELDIHSPSRVFAGLGFQIPAGVAQGVDRGASDVNASVEQMVTVPSVPSMEGVTAASPASTSARADAGTTVHITIGEVHVHGAGAEAAEDFVDQLATQLERVGITLGSR